MAQQQQNPFADLPAPVARVMPFRPPTLREIREAYPNLSPFQRGNKLQELETRWRQTYAGQPAPGETSWGFGRRSIGEAVGGAVRNFITGPGIAAPPFAQQAQQTLNRNWTLPGRAVLDAAEGVRFANDTQLARAERAQARTSATQAGNVVAQAGRAFRPPQAQGPAPGQGVRQDPRLPFVITEGRNFSMTPDTLQFWQTRILGQESSGGNQFDANGRPLVGRDRNGNIPPASRGGPAYGAGQMQIGTARAVARAHGIPFSEARLLRDRDYNMNLSLRHFTDLRNKYGGDLALAAAAYHSGEPAVDRARERYGANWIQGLGPEGQNYVRATTGGGDLRSNLNRTAQGFGNLPAPPFNSAPFDQAEAATLEAGRLRMQPFSGSAIEAPRPEMEALIPFEAPDFTAGNEAFERARPQNPFAEEGSRPRLQRRRIMQGMAEALMSMNWSSGPGVGELLAKVGAGMMGGRVAADDEIDQRMRVFDEQMRSYELALANRNDQQATAIRQVANQNIEAMNNRNTQIFGQRLQEWARDLPQFTVGADGSAQMVVRRRGEGGEVTTTVTPLGHAIQAQTLLGVANIRLAEGNALAEHERMIWGAAREDARTALGAVLSNPEASPVQRDQAATLELAGMVGSVVRSGRWQELMPSPEASQALLGQAYGAAGYDPNLTLPPNEQQAEVIQNFITTQLLQNVVQGGPEGIQRLYNNPAAQAARAAELSEDRRVTTRTDARGRQSTTVSQGY